jgi:hypothetical protein
MTSAKTIIVARMGAVALASMVAGLSAAPARAQFFGGFFDIPPRSQPDEAMPGAIVARRLAARGLYLIGPMQRNGGVYLADVRDRGGHRRRLVIDAYSGGILQIFAYEETPRPPASIPGAGYGAAYGSRYAPEAAPPSDSFTVGPPSGSSSRTSVERERRLKREARQEVRPQRPVHHEKPAPSQATKEPGPIEPKPRQDESAPASAHREARPKTEPGPSASPPHGEQAQTVSPKPAAATTSAHESPGGGATKPSAPKPAPTGKGYANGVPINPLD